MCLWLTEDIVVEHFILFKSGNYDVILSTSVNSPRVMPRLARAFQLI